MAWFPVATNESASVAKMPNAPVVARIATNWIPDFLPNYSHMPYRYNLPAKAFRIRYNKKSFSTGCRIASALLKCEADFSVRIGGGHRETVYEFLRHPQLLETTAINVPISKDNVPQGVTNCTRNY